MITERQRTSLVALMKNCACKHCRALLKAVGAGRTKQEVTRASWLLDQRAYVLYQKLGNYAEVARQLGFCKTTITRRVCRMRRRLITAEKKNAELPQNLSSLSLDEKCRLTVDVLNISVRTGNCLQVAQIKSVGDLLATSPGAFFRTKNFGRRSIRELADVLHEQLGLTWEEEP